MSIYTNNLILPFIHPIPFHFMTGSTTQESKEQPNVGDCFSDHKNKNNHCNILISYYNIEK